ncbi:MAG: long-chain fatty acid--CoA ligase [Mycobacteriales bacterium]
MSQLPVLSSRSGPAAIGAQLHLGAWRTPNRSAVELVSGERRTYAELDERSSRLAQALLAHGLRRGDRVAIWLGNCLDYIDVYLAAAKAALVVVQVNIRHKASEARFQLEDSGARALVFCDAVAEYVEAIGPGQDMLLLTTGAVRLEGALDFEDFLARGANQLPPDPDDDDLLVIGYTSGTTGFPKGAELTHRSVKTLGQTNALTNRYQLASSQVFGLSLSFTAGIPAHVLTHMYVGGTTILLPDWDTEMLVHTIERHRATFTILPSPPITDFCELLEPDPSPVASLVSVLHSASKAPPEHLERLVGVIGSRLVEGWGMTENSGGLIAATVAADYEPPRPGIFDSTGIAAPDAVIRILAPDGAVLPHDGDAVGQLVAHSASLARGYWNNPQASADTFRDGWYYTGDLGRIDPDGYVYVLDRRPDLIISGGMNLYPSELERVILALPGVRECAVVAAPHPRWGQTPVAFVVVKDDAVTREDVLAQCDRELAGYKKPSAVHLVDELPRNASGKILKHKLRDQLFGDAG